MKHTKKIFALLLVVIMVMAVGFTAVGAVDAGEGGNGSITVNHAVGKTTYDIYRMLDLEVDDTNNVKAYKYTVNSDWTAFFSEDGAGSGYVNIDEKGVVTWKKQPTKSDAEAVSDLATAAKAFVKDNGIGEIASATAPEDATSVEFTGLNLGYYLLISDLNKGSVASIDTTNPNAQIDEKNASSSNEKEVKEGDTWGKENDAAIGDTVEFRSTINVVDLEPKDYVFHDTMSAGLEFDPSSVKVELNGNVIQEGYTLTTTELTDDCTFEIAIADETIKNGDIVVIYYNATITEDAVINTAIPNKSKITYTNKVNETKGTPESKTDTYVWELNIYKYTKQTTDENKEIEVALKGVGFKLYKTENNVTKYAKVTDGKFAGWVDTEAEATELFTDVDGKISVVGIDSGKYFLKETTTPPGYNELKSDIEVLVSQGTDGKNTYTATMSYKNVGEFDDKYQKDIFVDGKLTVKVLNTTGTELPSTGGVGTMLFILLGALAVIGTGLFLVVNKRMSKESV